MSDLVGQCDTHTVWQRESQLPLMWCQLWSRVVMMDGREAKIMDSDNDNDGQHRLWWRWRLMATIMIMIMIMICNDNDNVLIHCRVSANMDNFDQIPQYSPKLQFLVMVLIVMRNAENTHSWEDFQWDVDNNEHIRSNYHHVQSNQIVFINTNIFPKHCNCQRHNGREGWVDITSSTQILIKL